MTIEAKWSDFRSLDSERTISAANQLLPRWVTLMLVLAIAWQLASILWMLMPGSSAGDPIVATAAQVDALDVAVHAAQEVELANTHELPFVYGERIDRGTGHGVHDSVVIKHRLVLRDGRQREQEDDQRSRISDAYFSIRASERRFRCARVANWNSGKSALCR